MGLEGAGGHSSGEVWPEPNTKTNKVEVMEMLVEEASNLHRDKRRTEAMGE